MTPQERKTKVLELRKEHQSYFEKTDNNNALYIPKMAYRPSGKDELHVSFFPSELQKNRDIYTEFVSIEYDSEDPKRTLYLLEHNPTWDQEYEIVTSSSGFERHIVPVSNLKVINDVTDRNKDKVSITNPDERSVVDVLKGIERALLSINQKLSK
tara:strand:+ start:184 stop:648 length:465 start_codon:yes stop_codon:yes gene_type:complete